MHLSLRYKHWYKNDLPGIFILLKLLVFIYMGHNPIVSTAVPHRALLMLGREKRESGSVSIYAIDNPSP